MRRRRLVPVVLVLLAFALAAAMPASAFGARGKQWRARTLTHSSTDRLGVVISGDRLAWYDTETTPSVYTWKAGDRRPLRFTGPYGFHEPRVSGDRLAWTAVPRFTLEPLTVVSGGAYTWTSSAGVTEVGDGLAARIDVSGNRLVWDVMFSPPAHVMLWNLLTWTPGTGVATLSPAPADMGAPRVSCDRLAWWQEGTVRTWKAGDTTSTVLGPSRVHDADVLLSGDRVVWTDTPEDVAGIYTWTPGTGVVRVTTGETDVVVNAGNGDVSGDRIVWANPPYGTSAVIYTWTPSGGVVAIPSPATDNETPRVSGDRIVWAGGVSGRRQIYTWTPAEGVAAVTGDRNDNVDPVVSGGRIAWRQKRPGGAYQVVTAVRKR